MLASSIVNDRFNLRLSAQKLFSRTSYLNFQPPPPPDIAPSLGGGFREALQRSLVAARKVPRYRRNRTPEGSSSKFRLILRSRRGKGERRDWEKARNVGKRTRGNQARARFDFFDVLSAAPRAQHKWYSPIEEMTEDNNLQGQGFVLQVQRTAHIEKWTKCYSKNLFPLLLYIYIHTRTHLYIYSFFFFSPFSTCVYASSYLYVCIYRLLQSFSFFFFFMKFVWYLSRLLRSSLRTPSSSSYWIFFIFEISKIARGDSNMLPGVSRLYT